LSLGRNDIVRVHAGLLPALNPRSTKLRVRDLILNHCEHGGTKGFFSISGTKLTTARALAEKALRKICKDQNWALPELKKTPRPLPFQNLKLADFRAFLRDDRSTAVAYLEQFSKRESTVYLEDLLLRRTDWADEVDDLAEISEEVRPLIGSGSLLETQGGLSTPLSELL
jgi:glycerol-3-phosphate dehydrogenase